MLMEFFDSHGFLHNEFMQESCTVNAEYYKGLLDCLISRKNSTILSRPELHMWFFPPALQLPGEFGSNNSTVSDSKTSRKIAPLPYSPDLSPPTTSCIRR